MLGVQDPNSIAVIGLSCRFPGEASNAQIFWELLCEQRCTLSMGLRMALTNQHWDAAAYSKILKSRFNIDSFRDVTQRRLNTSIAIGGYFLKQNVAAFDAKFFNINYEEACAMDPQQRMMLEVVYEAMENAGISINKLAGSETSCIMGNWTNDWKEMMFRDVDSNSRYSLTGVGHELLSNRISWFYDLKGPSYSIGSACSSSLVALHVACQSLRVGEAKMSIVGGANLLLDPAMFVALSNQKMLSPDGRCKTFDECADGYGRGEGIAAVILKPIDDAIRDGDRIRAVIRATGVNQDGKTPGITLPNAEAQAALIRSTYASVGLGLDKTNYFEAHGTGTAAGDPIELQAISETFSRVRSKPLLVGSVKTNIGHLEAVAGIAALIKSVFILENGVIPPNLHFTRGNLLIPFKKWNISVPTSLTSWPETGPRRISINGFGLGGTNAHAIVDDAFFYLSQRGLPGYPPVPPGTDGANIQISDRNECVKSRHSVKNVKRLLVFSTLDRSGVGRQIKSYVGHLRRYLSGPLKDELSRDRYLRDLAFTLSEKRTYLPWRLAVVASSIGGLADSLDSSVSDKNLTRYRTSPYVGFVFTGQGAQWANMGIELLRYRSFRLDVDESSKYLTSIGCQWSVIDELERPDKETRINLPEYSQPICALLQIALVNLLNYWNISPSRVVGHSSGEIAAAYCMGALSKEDALKIAYHRGRLSSQIPNISSTSKGAMLAVKLSADKIAEYMDQLSNRDVVVACVNSPSSITISGDASSINELEARLKIPGVFARKLKVTVAYHSPQMDLVAMAYWNAIADIKPRPGNPLVQMYSSVTGSLIDADELGPTYWVRNLTSPVLFSDAVACLLASDTHSLRNPSVDVLVEVGPHSALQGPSREIMKHHSIQNVEYTTCLSRGRDAVETLLEAAGLLFTYGVPVAIQSVNTESEPLISTPSLLCDLPPYSWDHSQEFWATSRIVDQQRFREMPNTSLLGAPYPMLIEGQNTWRGFLRLAEVPWVRDHMIHTSTLYPAAGFIVMAIEACRQLNGPGRRIKSFNLRDIQISAALVLTEDTPVEYIIQIQPHMVGTRGGYSPWFNFRISSSPDRKALRQNCAGLIRIENELEVDSAVDRETEKEYESIRSQLRESELTCQETELPDEFYNRLDRIGLVYGPTFRNLTDIQSSKGMSCCTIEVPDISFDIVSERPHIIHPTTLDAMFHTAFAALEKAETAMVPVIIEEVLISATLPFQPGSVFKGFSKTEKYGFRNIMSNIQMLDASDMLPVVQVRGFCCTETPDSIRQDLDAVGTKAKNIISKLVWNPAVNYLSSNQKRQLLEIMIPPDLTQQAIHNISQLEEFTLNICTHVFTRVSPPQASNQSFVTLYNMWKQVSSRIDHKMLNWKQGLPASTVNKDTFRVEFEVLETIRNRWEEILLRNVDSAVILDRENLRTRYCSDLENLNIITCRLSHVSLPEL